MAGKNGVVRTVGYLGADGKEHRFGKEYKRTEGKRMVEMYKGFWDKAVTRLTDGTWEEIDDFLFGDVKAAVLGA